MASASSSVRAIHSRRSTSTIVAAGVIKPWAQEILDRVPEDAYREVSVSGSGVHVILRAKVRAGGMRRGRVELYSRERYIALTGVRL